jgi:hypothetical protein
MSKGDGDGDGDRDALRVHCDTRLEQATLIILIIILIYAVRKRGISTVLTPAYFRPQPFQAIRSSVAFAIR